jgi:hypothetical protein
MEGEKKMNPICRICGLYELNDGSEDTLWTCECDEGFFDEEIEEHNENEEL